MLSISQRAYVQVLREKGINSKLKNRYTLDEHYFDEIDTPNKAYFLGLIAADGFIGGNNFSIYSIDKEILNFFKKEIKFPGELTEGHGNFENSKTGFYLRFSSKQIVSSLKKHGIYTNKSLSFSEIPEISENLKRHFLRGYFDGYDSVSFSYRTYSNKYTYPRLTISIIGTNEFLLNFIEEANIKSFHINKSKTEKMKYLMITNKSDICNIYKLFYDDAELFLERKVKWINIYVPLIRND